MQDLYIHLDEEGNWSFDLGASLRSLPMQYNQGDIRPMRIWFTRAAEGPQLRAVVPMPAPFTTMHLYGRAAADLESANKALFDAGDWSEVTEEGVTHYEGVLNLNTANITTYLGTTERQNVTWQLELSSSGPVRRWTPIKRGTGVLFRDVYRDSDSPPDEEEVWPSPDDIALNTGSNYRIQAGVFQMKNTQTGTWHAVHLTGAAGSEQLVIES